jgi:hypothetical protein
MLALIPVPATWGKMIRDSEQQPLLLLEYLKPADFQMTIR